LRDSSPSCQVGLPPTTLLASAPDGHPEA
jgi:hypothetical protein